MTNEIIHVIKQRRSVRRFKPEQIPDGELEIILEAGRFAPSAGNRQGWHFTVVQNRELLAWLNHESKEAAKGFDIEYIRKMANNVELNVYYHAPTLVIVSGDATHAAIEADCAAATQNMLLTAESLRIGSCWINFIRHPYNGPNKEQFLSKLGIPQGYRPYSSVALGYRDGEVGAAPKRKGLPVNYIR